MTSTPGTTDRVVDSLVHAGLLDAGSRPRAVAIVGGALVPTAATSSGASARRALPRLVEVVAYLGGALVLAATGLFLAQEWDDLGFSAQVGVLVVAMTALVATGVVSSRAGGAITDPSYDARRRLAGAAMTGAAVAAWGLVGIVVDHYVSQRPFDWPLALGALAALVVTAIGYRWAPTALGVLAAATSLSTLVGVLVERVGDVLGIGDSSQGALVGIVFLAVGAAWLVATESGLFGERMVARAVGVSIAFGAAQIPVLEGQHEWLGYLLTAIVVGVAVAAYVARLAWPYLAVAVIGVTVVVPEAVSDWTDGSLGVVGGVLLTGITLLLTSFAGYRMRSESLS